MIYAEAIFLVFLYGGGVTFAGLAFWEWLKVRNHVQLNEWRRLASQGINAVPDFIPPGAEAEVVVKTTLPIKIDTRPFNVKPEQLRCLGCMYAGRYVLKSSVDYSEFAGQK